ncbi:hypothetical protein [Gloeocapsopsis dulcis]|nr:hypothetical protein [Gloeocapsopsis dulcis]WNN91173.1 hypothetical protein P0S91_08905 [Gloeocapsopsis dulcis]
MELRNTNQLDVFFPRATDVAAASVVPLLRISLCVPYGRASH